MAHEEEDATVLTKMKLDDLTTDDGTTTASSGKACSKRRRTMEYGNIASSDNVSYHRNNNNDNDNNDNNNNNGNNDNNDNDNNNDNNNAGSPPRYPPRYTSRVQQALDNRMAAHNPPVPLGSWVPSADQPHDISNSPHSHADTERLRACEEYVRQTEERLRACEEHVRETEEHLAKEYANVASISYDLCHDDDNNNNDNNNLRMTRSPPVPPGGWVPSADQPHDIGNSPHSHADPERLRACEEHVRETEERLAKEYANVAPISYNLCHNDDDNNDNNDNTAPVPLGGWVPSAGQSHDIGNSPHSHAGPERLRASEEHRRETEERLRAAEERFAEVRERMADLSHQQKIAEEHKKSAREVLMKVRARCEYGILELQQKRDAVDAAQVEMQLLRERAAAIRAEHTAYIFSLPTVNGDLDLDYTAMPEALQDKYQRYKDIALKVNDLHAHIEREGLATLRAGNYLTRDWCGWMDHLVEESDLSPEDAMRVKLSLATVLGERFSAMVDWTAHIPEGERLPNAVYELLDTGLALMRQVVELEKSKIYLFHRGVRGRVAHYSEQQRIVDEQIKGCEETGLSESTRMEEEDARVRLVEAQGSVREAVEGLKAANLKVADLKMQAKAAADEEEVLLPAVVLGIT
eukprot:g4173.t1